MARYQIKKTAESTVAIEVVDLGGQQGQRPYAVSQTASPFASGSAPVAR
jgi:hypothetical protein